MNQLHRCKPLLGTYAEVAVAGDYSNRQLIELSELAFSKIIEIQQVMSFHDLDSELSHVNLNAHRRPVQVSTSLWCLLSLCHELHQISKGLFDVAIAAALIEDGQLPLELLKQNDMSVDQYGGSWCDVELGDDQTVFFHKPLLLDLGGIAKGYAVDRAFTAVNNECCVSVNAGGDLRTSRWQGESIEVRTRLNKTESVTMRRAAVATSAGYYNQGRSAIVDPLNKKPITKPTTVTAFANECVIADAFTKLMTLGFDDIAAQKRYSVELLRLP